MTTSGPRPHFAATKFCQAAPKDSFHFISQNLCGLRAQRQRLAAPPSKGQIIPLPELVSEVYGTELGAASLMPRTLFVFVYVR